MSAGKGLAPGTESWWGWHGAGHRTSVRHELKTTPNGRLQVPPHTPQGPRPAPQFSGRHAAFSSSTATGPERAPLQHAALSPCQQLRLSDVTPPACETSVPLPDTFLNLPHIST